MTRADVVEDPLLRHRLRFERITDREGAEALRIEIVSTPAAA